MRKGAKWKRRKLLKATSGSLFTGAIVSRNGKADSFVEIITDEYKGKPIATEQVPKKWYDQIISARRGRKNSEMNIQGNLGWSQLGKGQEMNG